MPAEKILRCLLNIQREEGPKCNPEERAGLHRKLINLSLEFVHHTSQHKNGNQSDKDDETINAVVSEFWSALDIPYHLKQCLLGYRNLGRLSRSL